MHYLNLMATKGEISSEEAMRIMKAWCATREVCISEAFIKLKKLQVKDENSEGIISSLLELKFIDEERYAKAFAKDKMRIDKWGELKVRQALKLKRIPEKFINNAIAEIESSLDKETIITELLNKKLKSLKKDLNNHEVYTKLVRFGISRGFSLSKVTCVAKKIVGENHEF